MKRFGFILMFILAISLILTACNSNSSKSSSGKKEIIIGVDDQFAPMGFLDENSKLVGFDIDYAKATVKEMGYEAKFQPIDWSTKEAELQSGRIDLIWNGYTITKERKEKVLFSKPYLENAQVVVTLVDSKITALSDLAGKSIGLQSQSSAAEALKANPLSKTVKDVSEYKNNVLALNDLKAGRTVAVVIDSVVIDYYMTKEESTYKILSETLSPEQYGIGVKKGKEDLLKELQSALDALNKNGEAAKISNKWFGESKVLN